MNSYHKSVFAVALVIMTGFACAADAPVEVLSVSTTDKPIVLPLSVKADEAKAANVTPKATLPVRAEDKAAQPILSAKEISQNSTTSPAVQTAVSGSTDNQSAVKTIRIGLKPEVATKKSSD